MDNLNIDQLKMDCCKILAVISIIDKAVTKKRELVSGRNDVYYEIFGGQLQKEADLQDINAVIARLRSYLTNLKKGALSCE